VQRFWSYGFQPKVLGAAAATLALIACAKNPENIEAKQRIWDNEPVLAPAEALAKEEIDAGALARDPAAAARVLGMSIEEAAIRFSYFEYSGKAQIVVAGGRRKIDITEDTRITQGLHGSFSLVQKNENGDALREVIYNNGMMFVRNGTGAMRAQGVVNDQHLIVRAEAWEPLAVFSGYFGKRFGLKKVGPAVFMKRNAIDYQIFLADGPELIPGTGDDKAKKPLSLKGQLLVDIQTGVVLKAKIKGKLEVPSANIPTSTVTPTKKAKKAKVVKSGTIRVLLTAKLKSIKGEEQRPKKFIDAIASHPTDLKPLAFMKGDTRTSTVIGGKSESKSKDPATKKPIKNAPAKKAKPAASQEP
jgi:hypothetical protein